MDFEKLATQISKPTFKWNSTDIESWLDFISMSNLVTNFSTLSINKDDHGVDGSCLHDLDHNDLETELGVKSKISRKKIMKWVEGGFTEFNTYLKNRATLKESMMDIC